MGFLKTFCRINPATHTPAPHRHNDIILNIRNLINWAFLKSSKYKNLPLINIQRMTRKIRTFFLTGEFIKSISQKLQNNPTFKFIIKFLL